jgi:hypothetical protein
MANALRESEAGKSEAGKSEAGSLRLDEHVEMVITKGSAVSPCSEPVNQRKFEQPLV